MDLQRRIEQLEAQESGSRRPAPNFRAGSFSKQVAFVEDDETRLGYAFCTRRAAKSYSFALKAFRRALKSRSYVLIAGLVRDEVKRIWWAPIVLDLIERYGVQCRTNETELSVRFPNGSYIYFLGMDADEKQKRKALGQKWALVGIDEAQDWSTDLYALVYHVLKPAVADYRGSIWLLGTPGLVSKGLFYDVTTGKEPGWTRHEWTAHENTTQPDKNLPPINEQWAAEIADLKARKPGVELTPWFRRNYLREWVVDESALVYRFNAERNAVASLPPRPKEGWHYVLGCDLGYTDPTAFVVAAYHDHDKTLYFVEVYKRAGMDVTDVANHAKALDKKYGFDVWIIDGANKQAVEEMKHRHDVPWTPADKTGKSDFIEIMNAEFLTGGIKLLPGAAPLASEYTQLIWDQKKLADGVREEDPRCDNHGADGGLYSWRHCFPYLSKEPEAAPPKPGTPQWFQAAQEAMQGAGDETEEHFMAMGRRLDQERRERDEAMHEPMEWT